MKVYEQYSLKSYNTFQIDINTDRFIEINQPEDLIDFCNSEYINISPRLILGGGSNILFTKNFEGIVLHSRLTSIEILNETDHDVLIKAGSGLNWDKFVEYCVERNWGGIENLSDIPGNVGAAPVQNIGAYGVEAKESIEEVISFNLLNKDYQVFKNEDCKFNYRYSIFKENELTNHFITHVIFRLSKKHILQTRYGSLEEEFSKLESKNINTLRQLIIRIRQSKLPSTEDLGSAGSFFKNPMVPQHQFKKLQKKYSAIPFYNINDLVKIPAAWLIEMAGMKGIRNGDVGTYRNQPLVIVNYNNAKGTDIVELSNQIKQKVLEQFNILLEPEVCFI